MLHAALEREEIASRQCTRERTWLRQCRRESVKCYRHCRGPVRLTFSLSTTNGARGAAPGGPGGPQGPPGRGGPWGPRGPLVSASADTGAATDMAPHCVPHCVSPGQLRSGAKTGSDGKSFPGRQLGTKERRLAAGRRSCALPLPLSYGLGFALRRVVRLTKLGAQPPFAGPDGAAATTGRP